MAMGNRRLGRLDESAGYTAVEALTVVAVMGVTAAFTAPSMLRFQAAQQVQSATSEVGGMLQRVRARAVNEAIPFLVLFQKEEVTDGERSAFALIVRDNDRSYTLTPPDDVETFTLGPEAKPKVRQYGEADPGTPSAFEGLTPPATDRSMLVENRTSSGGLLGGVGSLLGGGSSGSGSGGLLGGLGGLLGGGSSGSGSSGSGSGSSGSGSGSSGSGSSGSSGSSSSGTSTPRENVDEVATNGTTFPMSEDAGVPSIAFNERGIPVSVDSPQEWGTGAGAVYLTDNESAVYAAVLSPLGEVSMARYDAKSSSWR
jgi:type II secretory pathway pseudopilin PulG